MMIANATELLDLTLGKGVSLQTLANHYRKRLPAGVDWTNAGRDDVLAALQAAIDAQPANAPGRVRLELTKLVETKGKVETRQATTQSRRDATDRHADQQEAITDVQQAVPASVQRPTYNQISYAISLGADSTILRGMTRDEVSNLIDNIKGNDPGSRASRAGARLGIRGQIWDD